MCTALTLRTRDHYFGRTLDLDRSYGEEVCIAPRRYPFAYRTRETMTEHYAIIGMATVVGGIPLFYDAGNEHGLSMAGLNFPGNAYYPPMAEGKDNIAPFEFIPWILGQCKTVAEARILLSKINLVNIAFSPQLPLSPLHWMLDDGQECIVVESMTDGLHIHDNPAGVMTNNPPFEQHMLNLNHYRHLRPDNGESLFAGSVPVKTFCQGLGAVGLPGDLSSISRFVRVAFGRANSVCGEDELSSVSQFFHLLGFVEMPRGTVRTDEGGLDITGYTACLNADKGRYYYTTYNNHRINCVDMHRSDLDSAEVYRFPLVLEEEIGYRN